MTESKLMNIGIHIDEEIVLTTILKHPRTSYDPIIDLVDSGPKPCFISTKNNILLFGIHEQRGTNDMQITMARAGNLAKKYCRSGQNT